MGPVGSEVVDFEVASVESSGRGSLRTRLNPFRQHCIGSRSRKLQLTNEAHAELSKAERREL